MRYAWATGALWSLGSSVGRKCGFKIVAFPLPWAHIFSPQPRLAAGCWYGTSGLNEPMGSLSYRHRDSRHFSLDGGLGMTKRLSHRSFSALLTRRQRISSLMLVPAVLSVHAPSASGLSAHNRNLKAGRVSMSAVPTTVVSRGGGTSVSDEHKPTVIFVLGGPGSGKGTQCAQLAAQYGYVHLSAGELLRQERESGSSDGQLIDVYIREGRIVPVEISLGLLQRAMRASKPFSRFLIDGFPRNSDNVKGWEAVMAGTVNVRCVLFLYCPEDVLESRLLMRGKSSGRTDDNAETARRRFRTYVETTLPVVELFERQGLVCRVDGDQDVNAVFRDVTEALRPIQEGEVLDAQQMLTRAVAEGDEETIEELCVPDLTEIHDEIRDRPVAPREAVLLSPKYVRMLNGPAAIVTSEGIVPDEDGNHDEITRETRAWQVHDGRWKCVHVHSSRRR